VCNVKCTLADVFNNKLILLIWYTCYWDMIHALFFTFIFSSTLFCWYERNLYFFTTDFIATRQWQINVASCSLCMKNIDVVYFEWLTVAKCKLQDATLVCCRRIAMKLVVMSWCVLWWEIISNGTVQLIKLCNNY
jgi:hypothetical protein